MSHPLTAHLSLTCTTTRSRMHTTLIPIPYPDCSAAQVALLTSISAAPWVVKPLYGFLSDTVPILGYRRRSYLVICGVLGAPCIRFADNHGHTLWVSLASGMHIQP